jgi:hypothetical protein
VVTHLTINPPVDCLGTAERTGSAVVSYPNSTKILNFTVCSNVALKRHTYLSKVIC